jgi:hypothetical protein
MMVQASPIKARLYLKIMKTKRVGSMTQVSECLPDKCKALSSKLQYHQKENTRKKEHDLKGIITI